MEEGAEGMVERFETEDRVSASGLRPHGYEMVKRGIDIVGAGCLLVALSPVMVAVAIAVKSTSSGPVVYCQNRLTAGGRVFRLMKFRSMRVDAELASGATFATRKDPRVTWVGSFLRKTRLDELPQLVNVLRGEMSLIGPRPERPEIASGLAQSIPKFRKRLETRAGLTGLAQVIQGYPDGHKGYRRKVGLDVIYIRKKSLFMDAWIALRTVSVILTGSGAR